MIHRTLRNDSLPPLKRLRAFVDTEQVSESHRLANGFLIGTSSAEASEHSEVIRKRLVEIYESALGGRAA
jgi:TetR/AcrR family transcriptional repressor of nem operon